MGIASDAFAQMTRDMWAAWVANFMPIENKLIDYATDVTLPGERAAQAAESVREAFARRQRPLGRGIHGMPVSPGEAEAAARDRAITQSLAEVNAANVARTMTIQRQRGLVGVPMPQAESFQAPIGR